MAGRQLGARLAECGDRAIRTHGIAGDRGHVAKPIVRRKPPAQPPRRTAAAPARTAPASPTPRRAKPEPTAQSAAATEPAPAQSFVPVTVLTANQLAATPGATLGDVLFTQPGITSSTFAPGASRPIIRGLDNFRVRVQENGLASGDVSAIGEDHAVPIDPLSSEQIEVIRGPAALRYGPGAIGGVVSTVNNRIPEPFTAAGVSTTLKTAVSSVDRGREAGVIVDGRAQDFAIHGDFYTRRAEDYAIPGGRQANTYVQSTGEAVGGSYFLPDNGGFVGVAVQHFASLYGIPGTAAAASRTRIDLDQVKVTSRGEIRVGSLVDTIRFWLGASDYKHNELGLADGIDGIQTTFKNREQEGRVEAQLAPLATGIGVLNTAVGVQFGHQELGTGGDAGELLAPLETGRFAGFIFNELQISQSLRLQAAGRIGTVSVQGSGVTFPSSFVPDGSQPIPFARRRDFTPVSASIGLLQDLPWGMVARLNGQYVERAPEALELFAKGPHDSPGTFEIGNANLTKEAATSIEAGLKRAAGAFRFDVSAYHTGYKGFIFKRLTGLRCGDNFDSCGIADELRQVVYDQRNATFTGAEMSAQLDLTAFAGGMAGVDGQYDIVRARFVDGSNVPRIPPQRLGGGVFWRDANWFARVGLLHAFAQTELAAEETPTPGYNLLKAELSYTKKLKPEGLGPREVTLGLTGTNLLDDDVRNAVSFKKDEVLLPGRGVRAFATIRW